MPARIVDYELWRIQLPAGMTIGDSMCHYEKFSVTVLCLKSDQGHWGWGFGEKVTDGVFTKPAPWHTPMATLAEIRQTFSTQYWPIIRGHNAFELKNRSPSRFGTITYLHIAIREALWDLMGKELELLTPHPPGHLKTAARNQISYQLVTERWFEQHVTGQREIVPAAPLAELA